MHDKIKYPAKADTCFERNTNQLEKREITLGCWEFMKVTPRKSLVMLRKAFISVEKNLAGVLRL